jgi:predicted nucleic-acid-binding Zn-ribbon protein
MSELNQTAEASLAICPKCAGQRVASTVQHKEGNVVLRPVEAGLGFLDWRFSGLTAHTCKTCGLTEFYANDPSVL